MTRYYVGYCDDKPNGEVFGHDGKESPKKLLEISGYDSIEGPFETVAEAQQFIDEQ